MSELSERVAREHHFLEWVGTDPQCVCGEVLRGRPGPGAQRIPAHVAEVTEAAVREAIAADIEAAVLPTHPNTGYRDGIARAARIARGET